mmetsp:Transcript_116307/g.340267  ORF Transcript_116307/g.340267 Transcript_116307/m.340267 type:complete len:274 (-) Transcript_116307:68-889(-)
MQGWKEPLPRRRLGWWLCRQGHLEVVLKQLHSNPRLQTAHPLRCQACQCHSPFPVYRRGWSPEQEGSSGDCPPTPKPPHWISRSCWHSPKASPTKTTSCSSLAGLCLETHGSTISSRARIPMTWRLPSCQRPCLGRPPSTPSFRLIMCRFFRNSASVLRGPWGMVAVQFRQRPWKRTGPRERNGWTHWIGAMHGDVHSWRTGWRGSCREWSTWSIGGAKLPKSGFRSSRAWSRAWTTCSSGSGPPLGVLSSRHEQRCFVKFWWFQRRDGLRRV